MSNLSERLNTEDEIPELREPEDADNPRPSEAPFELKEARPLSQTLGDLLTDTGWVGEDANADVVLRHVENPELTVWIARLGSSEAPTYVLSCWGWEHKMHFEGPKETVEDVIEQASGSPYWTLDIPDESLLESFIEEL